jgi:hypothetical protein
MRKHSCVEARRRSTTCAEHPWSYYGAAHDADACDAATRNRAISERPRDRIVMPERRRVRGSRGRCHPAASAAARKARCHRRWKNGIEAKEVFIYASILTFEEYRGPKAKL